MILALVAIISLWSNAQTGHLQINSVLDHISKFSISFDVQNIDIGNLAEKIVSTAIRKPAIDVIDLRYCNWRAKGPNVRTGSDCGLGIISTSVQIKPSFILLWHQSSPGNYFNRKCGRLPHIENLNPQAVRILEPRNRMPFYGLRKHISPSLRCSYLARSFNIPTCEQEGPEQKHCSNSGPERDNSSPMGHGGLLAEVSLINGWQRAVIGTVIFTFGVLGIAIGLSAFESKMHLAIRVAGYAAAAIGPALIMLGIAVTFPS